MTRSYFAALNRGSRHQAEKVPDTGTTQCCSEGAKEATSRTLYCSTCKRVLGHGDQTWGVREKKKRRRSLYIHGQRIAVIFPNFQAESKCAVFSYPEKCSHLGTRTSRIQCSGHFRFLAAKTPRQRRAVAGPPTAGRSALYSTVFLRARANLKCLYKPASTSSALHRVSRRWCHRGGESRP